MRFNNIFLKRFSSIINKLKSLSFPGQKAATSLALLISIAAFIIPAWISIKTNEILQRENLTNQANFRLEKSSYAAGILTGMNELYSHSILRRDPGIDAQSKELRRQILTNFYSISFYDQEQIQSRELRNKLVSFFEFCYNQGLLESTEQDHQDYEKYEKEVNSLLRRILFEK